MRTIRLSFPAALLALACTSAAVAQVASQMPPVPVDTAVRIGKLDNGLTYYIRHNEYPADMANFYIAQRVGSINEDDNQRGLAHFLEHMAFNGSEHFAGNGIIDYTRSLGVQFGRNLNAYTSTDETVYNINDVPVTRQTAVDSCLLILKDWSNGLLLEEEEIDKERGVIHEEWRLRSSAMQRMLERSLPALYPGSKYAYRMPIGLMDVVDNFEPQALRDYYHKWYRPDNQAIVVVGDIDVNHVEERIRQLFGAIDVPAGAAQVVAEPVPFNNEAIYVSEKDKEMPFTQIMLMVKTPATPDSLKAGMDYMMESYMRTVAGSMLCSRLGELAQVPDCPFLEAVAGYEKYIMSKTMCAFSVSGIPKDGLEMETLQAMYSELRRIREHGFTETEYERARADYMSALEKAYTNRSKTKNDNYARQYCRHYLDNEPIPSIEDEYQIMSMLTPALPVDYVNMYVRETVSETDTNLVVLFLAQEKDGAVYKTPADMRTAVAKSRAESVDAYVDNVKDEPLIAQLPERGSIISETDNAALGFKEILLSNGARAILKKTDFKDDEVLMSACAPGGLSLYGEADFSNMKVMDVAVECSGLGNFSHTELQKALAGKTVGVGAQFKNTLIKLNGSSTPKDLETMFQLAHLYFTGIAKDEASYENVVNTLRTVLRNKGLKPEAAFSDSVSVTLHSHNPRLMPLQESDIDNADYDRILQMAGEMLSNPGAFTFTFAGNFDEEQLREFLCVYIASLPRRAEEAQPTDVATFAKGEITNSFKRPMETPKANVRDIWYSDAPYTLENSVLADAAAQVLSMYCLKVIREDAGAAYSVGASGYASRVLDRQQVFMQTYCPTDPDKAQTAIELLQKGVAAAAETTDADMLRKVKEYMLKQADDDAKKNNYWLSVIEDYLLYGIDMHNAYKDTVQSLTPESVSAFVKNVLLKDGNHIQVVMMPE